MPRSAPSVRARRVQGRQADGLDPYARASSRCAPTSPRRSSCRRATIRCIHAEGSGCYGHNGADDVALDAALLARAVTGGRCGCNGCATTSSPGSPTAPRWRCRPGALVADGRIVDWNYERLEQQPLDAAGRSTSGINLLAAWYLAEPQRPGPPRHAAAADGRRRPQRGPALRLPEPEDHAPFHPGHADPRSRRCARSAPMPTCSRSSPSWTSWRPPPAPIRSRSACAPEGPARARRDRGRGQDGRLEARREGRRPARPRHRLCQVQEPRQPTSR